MINRLAMCRLSFIGLFYRKKLELLVNFGFERIVELNFFNLIR